MSKITAAKAQSLVQSYKEATAPKEIEKFLDEVYSKITAAATNGHTSVDVLLKPYAVEYKARFVEILKEQGYKVKFKTLIDWRDSSDEYIKVSWST